jgi:D-alanine transaminase/branched-chain amino acid aminotransferase
LQPELRASGADDALYHWDGKISECPRSNIFVVTQEGQLVTPADGVLSGITRRHVLSLAADMGAAETNVTLEMLRAAREVFVTSTSKAITPVAAIGDLAWNTSAYSLTPLLQQRFANLVEDDIRTYKY